MTSGRMEEDKALPKTTGNGDETRRRNRRALYKS